MIHPAESATISSRPRPTRYGTNLPIEWPATKRSSQAMDAYATTKLTMVPTTVWPMPMSPDSASLSS